MLLKEVRRRTGLTRMQIRYLEQRELIGFIARSDERRIFTERQVTLLELIARFRELGATLDEAAALANESLGGDTAVPDDRIAGLLARALSENERRARGAARLAEIARRRREGVA